MQDLKKMKIMKPIQTQSPLPPKSPTLDFPTAIQAVTEGKKTTKLEWGNPEFYGVLKDGLLMLHKPDGNFYQWIVSDGDLLGQDWIILS